MSELFLSFLLLSVKGGVFPGQTTSDDIPLTSLEESLLSLEKLDRASPELWPEQSKFSIL